MTANETKALGITTQLWEQMLEVFKEEPVHADMVTDARQYIHQLQALIMCRPTIRKLNEATSNNNDQ
jgi:hypothetical protein